MAEDFKHDSLLREVDEDLRQERYTKLWKKYGAYVIGAAVALVLGVAGHQGWQAWDMRTRTEQSDRFVEAVRLSSEGDAAAAEEAFVELAENGGEGYATLARLRAAALRADRGDTAGAAALYREIADDDGVADSFRGLATVLGALHELNTADPVELSARLEPLTAPDSPWRFSALEISALLANRGGDIDRARELFRQIEGDPEAPRGARDRAAEMLAILG